MQSHELPDIEQTAERLNGPYQVELGTLEVGQKIEVETQNTTYLIERRSDGCYISGNEKYCPEPTKAYIAGTTSGGSSIKPGFIVEGGHLEFTIPDKGRPITTSEIVAVTPLDEE